MAAWDLMVKTRLLGGGVAPDGELMGEGEGKRAAAEDDVLIWVWAELGERRG